MKILALSIFMAATLGCLAPTALMAVTPSLQDFEGLIQADPAALAINGWLFCGNVFTPEGDHTSRIER